MPRQSALDAREQGIERLLPLASALRLPAAPNPLDCAMKALVIEWLQQVIHRADVERLEGILIVSGDEDDERQGIGIERASQRHPIERVHLDIEEQQIRRPCPDRLESGAAVAILANHVEIGHRARNSPVMFAGPRARHPR